MVQLIAVTLEDLRWADKVTNKLWTTLDSCKYEDVEELSDALSDLHIAAVYYELGVAQGYRSGHLRMQWPNFARRAHNALLAKNSEMASEFGLVELPLLKMEETCK